MDAVVDVIVKCFEADSDAIQLQITRVLLTASTVPNSSVHGQSLVSCVRGCFKVWLSSSDAVVTNTARTALQRIVITYVQRMEIDAAERLETDFNVPCVPLDSLLLGDDTDATDRSLATTTSNASPTPVQTAEPESQAMAPMPASSSATDSSHVSNADAVVAFEPNHDVGSSSTALAAPPKAFDLLHELQRDVYMLVLLFCKNSSRPLAPRIDASDGISVRSHIMSLDLLKIIVNTSGRFLRENSVFIDLIRNKLCLVLLQNGVSPIGAVARAALGLFGSVLQVFKVQLKSEVGTFFSEVFLRLLESSVSSPEQRLAVLSLIHVVCKDARIIVDLFVNYDCEAGQDSVFQRTITILSKLARKTIAEKQSDLANAGDEYEPQTVREMSLQCMISLLKSMMDLDVSRRDIEYETAEPEGEAGGAESTPKLEGKRRESSAADAFLKEHQRKTGIVDAISLFNISIKKGMQALSEGGYVDVNDASSVAALFQSNKSCSKLHVGEYIGDHHTFNKLVMSAYIDLFDFRGLDLVAAMRRLLAAFQLPGEAQKIDRIIEKFAERYCACNPSVFASADTAYVLGYSLIMLSTDAHNPQVKKKMSKQEFLKNNRGINDGASLDDSYMSSLYDAIVGEAFKMEGHSSSASTSNREISFKSEAADILKSAASQLKAAKRRGSSSTYRSAPIASTIVGMLQVVWAPLLASFSVVFEENVDDDAMSALALEGLQHAVRLYAQCGLEVEKDAFIQSLISLTNLHNLSGVSQRNVEVVRTLIEIATSMGEVIGVSWEPLLFSLSTLDNLLQLSQHNGVVDHFDPNESGSSTEAARDWRFPVGGASDEYKRERARLLYAVSHERAAWELLSPAIDHAAIERVYTSSASLSDAAIVVFVEALVEVSRVESHSPTNPRSFSLQKLVEVASHNMNRIRIVWSRIWNHMGAHFSEVVLHPNVKFALYALDSLKQLAFKFLDLGELPHFLFQRDFLRPAVLALSKNNNHNVREIVLQYFVIIVQSRRPALKSGWRSVISGTAHSARDPFPTCRYAGYDLLKTIVESCLDDVVACGSFDDVVGACVAFCTGTEIVLQQQGVDLLQKTAETVLSGNAGSAAAVEELSDASFWFPVLTGLARVSMQGMSSVRSKAQASLFSLLRQQGSSFSVKSWSLLFRGVLLSLYDDIRHADEHLDPGCVSALASLVELLSSHANAMEALLRDVLVLLTDCMRHSSPDISLTGAHFLRRLALGAVDDPSRSGSDSALASVADTITESLRLSPPSLLCAAVESDGRNVDSWGRLLQTVQRACVVRGEICRLLCDAPSLGSHSRIRATLDDAAAAARATATDESVISRLGHGGDNDLLEMLWSDYAHASSAALRIRASDASSDMDEVVRRCGNALDDARAADTPMSPGSARAATAADGPLAKGQQLARAASLMLAEASIHALIDLRRHSQVMFALLKCSLMNNLMQRLALTFFCSPLQSAASNFCSPSCARQSSLKIWSCVAASG
jgi:brefeldin A-inhibited guanine nucleotide-exchange protein